MCVSDHLLVPQPLLHIQHLLTVTVGMGSPPFPQPTQGNLMAPQPFLFLTVWRGESHAREALPRC